MAAMEEIMARWAQEQRLPEAAAREAAARICFQALDGIRAVLRDDRLDDAQCFRRIEAIVVLLEDLGVDCGNQHDFG